ncbi:hypothetical protein B0H11DRAFT_1903522 [Mycena galericulata]|nr:hypothetical protein B0H11DRAFT_1903522 [Mycena galericulata]
MVPFAARMVEGVHNESFDNDEITPVHFLRSFPLAQRAPSHASLKEVKDIGTKLSIEMKQSSPGNNLLQLLAMADACNQGSDESRTGTGISDEIAQQFVQGVHLQIRSPINFTDALKLADGIAQQLVEGAHLQTRPPINLTGALKLAYRIGDYGLIDLVEGARIEQLQACAASLASTLHAMTRYFPADSKQQRNFVLDNRTATVVKMLDDFERQIVDARDMLALAKTMRGGTEANILDEISFEQAMERREGFSYSYEPDSKYAS